MRILPTCILSGLPVLRVLLVLPSLPFLSSLPSSSSPARLLGGEPEDGARIAIRAGETIHRLSRYLTGACIEDVNHEIYGGIYSQMLFGESFQEPAPAEAPPGFRAYGGEWSVDTDGVLHGGAGDGPKLVSDVPAFERGSASVEVLLSAGAGNAGLIVKVAEPGLGADAFDGYEVSLDAQGQILRLGRHRHDWKHIRDVPCPVPLDRWIPLDVRMTADTLEIRVEGRLVLSHEDHERPLRSGGVGLREWQRAARYRKFRVETGGVITEIPFRPSPRDAAQVSGMWRAAKRGSAEGLWRIEGARFFAGRQSQGLRFVGGEGEIGVENRGLNRWGLSFVAGLPYEGYAWVCSDDAAELLVTLESGDGARVHAEARLPAAGPEWRRFAFTLTPSASDPAGRFAIKLTKPGSVVLGHAFLQPGEWGRFRGLPVRRDVAEALIDQGLTVLRYGGSMINHPEYRWKKMIGPRDRRPPHRGTWYPHSSNGWGILDFLDFCEAAGFLAIPAFNMGETPRDMAEFIEYANGPEDSEWGRKRAADGHPKPYGLRHLQLGNEERVDAAYFETFRALAEAIWARDPEITLVVGDFAYGAPIVDPHAFTGAASGVTDLSAHEKILRLAKARGREVWFDVHVSTEGPGKASDLLALPSYVKALERVADGARHRVVVFEFNANNHQHRRALANAQAIHLVERLGLPVACSANCLQPYGQNDNGWNQGLLFLDPSRVWLQPPGYVTRMVSRCYEPLLVACEVEGRSAELDAVATRSEAGDILVLRVVHTGSSSLTAAIRLEGFAPKRPAAEVEELHGPLEAVNAPDAPARIAPIVREWTHGIESGIVRFEFRPRSYTVIRFR